MAETELLRLELVEVERLFDLYDHRIEVNLDERVTILHGPNGVGKTAVLGMIDALLKNHLSYFDNIPFRRLLLGFHDGSTLELRTNGAGTNKEEKYELTLTRDGETNSAHIDQRPREKPMASTGFFRNLPLEKLLSATEGPVRPTSAEPESTRYPESEESWLNAFLKKANAHFIEAERCYVLTCQVRPDLADRALPSSPAACTVQHAGRLETTVDQSVIRGLATT